MSEDPPGSRDGGDRHLDREDTSDDETDAQWQRQGRQRREQGEDAGHRTQHERGDVEGDDIGRARRPDVTGDLARHHERSASVLLSHSKLWTRNSLLSSRTNRTADDAAGGAARRPASTAESIRLELAEAWGEMGAAWGVTPAIARVQAYLMARQEPLTEREVREALGL